MLFAMTRLRGLGAIVIGSALAVLLALVAFSSDAQANHSWGNYHWARTNNNLFNLPLGDNVTLAWDSYLGTTATDWSTSSVLDTTIVAGKTSRSNCRPTSGRVEVCNYRYGSNGWLGVAQIWVNGSHIVQGTTKVNDTYFKTAKYNTPAWRNLVMCQEVGHTFGLDHQDEIFNNTNLGTCMDYTNDPSGTVFGQLNNLHPNAHDYDELAAIYSHFDSSTTVGGAAPGGKARGLKDPSQWGQLMKVA